MVHYPDRRWLLTVEPAVPWDILHSSFLNITTNQVWWMGCYKVPQHKEELDPLKNILYAFNGDEKSQQNIGAQL